MILCLIISLCGCNQKEDFNKTISNNNEVVVPKEPEYEDCGGGCRKERAG